MDNEQIQTLMTAAEFVLASPRQPNGSAMVDRVRLDELKQALTASLCATEAKPSASAAPGIELPPPAFTQYRLGVGDIDYFTDYQMRAAIAAAREEAETSCAAVLSDIMNEYGDFGYLAAALSKKIDALRQRAETAEADLRARLAEYEAARMAYASEFPLNEDGEPDVGSIHANIRAMKARLAAPEGEAVHFYRNGPNCPWRESTAEQIAHLQKFDIGNAPGYEYRTLYTQPQAKAPQQPPTIPAELDTALSALMQLCASSAAPFTLESGLRQVEEVGIPSEYLGDLFAAYKAVAAPQQPPAGEVSFDAWWQNQPGRQHFSYSDESFARHVWQAARDAK